MVDICHTLWPLWAHARTCGCVIHNKRLASIQTAQQRVLKLTTNEP